MKTGAWTPFETTLTTDTMDLFQKATDQLVGVSYRPIAVSTQVVAGTNYSFFCNGTPTYPNATTYAAMLEVYQQPDGSIHLTEIKRVDY